MSPSATLGSERRGLWQLACLAGITWLLYLAITLSARSLYISESGSHRVLVLLGLFGLACGCYFAAIRIAQSSPQTGSLMALIVTAGVLFRATMVLSNPIEEIDLYRYLWDGVVVTHGVSPFRYSPQQVLGASTDAHCRRTWRDSCACVTVRQKWSRFSSASISPNCRRSIRRSVRPFSQPALG